VSDDGARRAGSGRLADLTRRVRPGLEAECRLLIRAVWRGSVNFVSGADLTYASSIAYYALLSLFPFLLLALALVGRFSSSPGDRAEILRFVFQYFPRQFEFIRVQLDALSASGLRLSAAGFVVIAWAAMGVFGAITSAVNHAWGVERHPSYFQHKLVSFLMLVTAGVLLLAAFVIASAASVVHASWFSSVLVRLPGLHVLESLAARWSSLLLFIFVIGLLYYFVPNGKVRFRDVWLGAILSGLLWQIALSVFSWYVTDLSRLRVVHGSITAVIVFLVWVYISSMILLFGVEVSAAYARLRADRSESQPAAEPLGP
jgi:membrane protein